MGAFLILLVWAYALLSPVGTCPPTKTGTPSGGFLTGCGWLDITRAMLVISNIAGAALIIWGFLGFRSKKPFEEKIPLKPEPSQ
jgi:hypothetical protein